MSATNAMEDKLLSLIFTNIAATNIGDAAGLLPSATAGNFHAALHTGTIDDTSTAQTTNEATYTGYGRLAVPRSTAEFTVTTGVVTNDNLWQFGLNTATANTATFLTLGQASSGAGAINYYGAVSLVINVGINPQVQPGAFQLSLN